LKAAWFQPSNLSSENLVSEICVPNSPNLYCYTAGTHPRPTTSSLERGNQQPSPAKPNIKAIAAARERQASDREARVRALDLTRVDKPLMDGIHGGSVGQPSDNARSTWVETTALQKNRDVAYRGKTHDVEAHYHRRRVKDFARDSARVNNRFVRTDFIKNGAVAARGYNILTGQVEERRMGPSHADVPLVTPRQ
jgi:hypothetical protein